MSTRDNGQNVTRFQRGVPTTWGARLASICRPLPRSIGPPYPPAVFGSTRSEGVSGTAAYVCSGVQCSMHACTRAAKLGKDYDATVVRSGCSVPVVVRRFVTTYRSRASARRSPRRAAPAQPIRRTPGRTPSPRHRPRTWRRRPFSTLLITPSLRAARICAQP